MTLAGTELHLIPIPDEVPEQVRETDQEKMSGVASIVETVKNFNVKKYLPWIIGAVVLIIILKSASKKSVVS